MDANKPQVRPQQSPNGAPIANRVSTAVDGQSYSQTPTQQQTPTFNQPQGAQNVYVQNVAAPSTSSNGLGTAGFVLALIAVFTSWIPGLGWILWILGAILSLVGLSKTPRGLAIAGSVISFIGLIILLAAGAACSAMLGGI